MSEQDRTHVPQLVFCEGCGNKMPRAIKPGYCDTYGGPPCPGRVEPAQRRRT